MTPVTRREFVATTAAAVAGLSVRADTKKIRYAVIGTGHRGTGMWGAEVLKRFPETVELVGLSDTNPRRLEIARQMLGVRSPTFTDFEKMCDETKPEVLAITTVDSTHVEYIERALARG